MTSTFHTPKNNGDSLSNPDSINGVLSQLDSAVRALTQRIPVIDKDLTAPPASPTNGYAYIPAAAATGLWVGLENNFVFTSDGGLSWKSIAPIKGVKVYMIDEEMPYEWNGTAWVLGDRYIMSGNWNGLPSTGLILIRHEPNVSIRFPAGLTGTGSKLYGNLAATAETIFSMKKNGSLFGTLTVPAAGTIAVIAVASITDLLTTDEFTLVAPPSPDATFGDLAFGIAGIRI